MKITTTIEPSEFEAWGTAEDVLSEIVDNGFSSEFDDYANDQFPDGVEEKQFNDWLMENSDDILYDLKVNSKENVEVDVDELKDFVEKKLGDLPDKDEDDWDDICDEINSYAEDNDIVTWFYDEFGNKVVRDSEYLLKEWWEENGSSEFDSDNEQNLTMKARD